MTRPGEVEVRHGYSYNHLDRLAQIATNHAFGHGLDSDERYACAWHAIVVALYEATDPPSPQNLIRAGGQAITQAEQSRQQTLGYDTHARWAGPATIGRYWKYWNPTAGPLPEDIIDTVAMRQIMATLTDRDRHVLLLLALLEDYDIAAAAAGVDLRTYYDQVRQARARFFRLWHQGERPAGLWKTHRRIGRQPA